LQRSLQKFRWARLCHGAILTPWPPPNKPLQVNAKADGRQSAGPVCDLQVTEVLVVPGVCGDEG
jgi:hypothetical protein